MMSKRIRIRRTATLILALSLVATAVLSPGEHVGATAAAAKAEADGKTTAISMNGFYVLFPGQTPYLKSGRLMVPLRTFANAIGASVLYDAQRKSAQVSALAKPVKGIRAGTGPAVFDEDLPLVFDPVPEIRGGSMFVPASLLLHGLQTYNWELMSGLAGTKTLVVRDKLAASASRMLAGMTADEQTPYPAETTAHPYPFYPLGSSFVETRDPSGKSAYELTLQLQNLAGRPVPGDGSELEIHAMNADNKEIAVKTLTGPRAETAKAQSITVHATVPKETRYIAFRSRILK